MVSCSAARRSIPYRANLCDVWHPMSRGLAMIRVFCRVHRSSGLVTAPSKRQLANARRWRDPAWRVPGGRLSAVPLLRLGHTRRPGRETFRQHRCSIGAPPTPGPDPPRPRHAPAAPDGLAAEASPVRRAWTTLAMASAMCSSGLSSDSCGTCRNAANSGGGALPAYASNDQ
jgi:hypothetical protein